MPLITGPQHPAPGPALRAPKLILSARPFLGTSSRSKQANLDCLVRFSKPENVAAVVAAAVQSGVGAIAPMNDANLLRALDLTRASCDLQVYPIIPNVIGYVRDATDYGMVGAGVRLVKRLSVGDLFGIGVRGLANIRGVLARDFTTILSILIEVEMAAFKRFRPSLVLLHGQLTDIAVALGNREVLRVFADVIRRRFGAEPGVVTNNLGALLASLDEWRIDIPVVVAPFNSKGFLMKPTKQACEALLARTARHIIADRVGTEGLESIPDAFAYLQRMGIGSSLIDISDAESLRSVVAQHPIAPLGPANRAPIADSMEGASDPG